MIDEVGRRRVATLVADHVRAVAGETRFAATRNFKLERAGIVVDLAFAADEFIGIMIRAADDTIDDLARELAVCRHYFDQVLAVVDACHFPAARACDMAGATLWSVCDSGRICEHISGTKNLVKPAALFEMMEPEQRNRLVRSLIPQGTAYPRSEGRE